MMTRAYLLIGTLSLSAIGLAFTTVSPASAEPTVGTTAVKPAVEELGGKDGGEPEALGGRDAGKAEELGGKDGGTPAQLGGKDAGNGIDL